MTFEKKEDFEDPREILYRCSDCGRIQVRGTELPPQCPDCGAPREHFVLIEED